MNNGRSFAFLDVEKTATNPATAFLRVSSLNHLSNGCCERRNELLGPLGTFSFAADDDFSHGKSVQRFVDDAVRVTLIMAIS